MIWKGDSPTFLPPERAQRVVRQERSDPTRGPVPDARRRRAVSVVAGDAVERRARPAHGVLPAVAGHAPAHPQGPRRRPEHGEVHQVVYERRPGFGAGHPHTLDRTVAGATRAPGTHAGPW